MFKRAKNKVAEKREHNRRKREERARIAKDQAEEEARLERERIQAEKDALMALNGKELLVEVIMTLRENGNHLAEIEHNQNDLGELLYDVKTSLDTLESYVSDLRA
ncbi:MAG: hypothetical protein LBL67_06415 [Coriobacteriales bacterium]|jgi:hypothetical protein|nr:hypothetical protein [Coriobacteriales bacterium]